MFDPCLLWLEGDSKCVVDPLNQKTHRSDDPLLADCKIFLGKMEAYKVSYIYREGNTGADFMANKGCDVDTLTYGNLTLLMGWCL